MQTTQWNLMPIIFFDIFCVNGCSSMSVISWRQKACLNLSLHAVIQIEIFVRQIHSNFK